MEDKCNKQTTASYTERCTNDDVSRDNNTSLNNVLINDSQFTANNIECTNQTQNGTKCSDGESCISDNYRTCIENPDSDESLEEDEDSEYHSAEEKVDDECSKAVDDQQRLLESTLSECEISDRRAQAKELKEKGNTLFKDGKYRKAIKAYTNALQLCPLSFHKDRSIMYSNRAASNMRMELYNKAISDSSAALENNPEYLKALLRRAELYEKTEKLDEALVDYQKVLEMDGSQHGARAACMRLPQQINDRNEKMKEEMMGKLKDLGNMVLKPFGLSTNNFQMQKDEQTGSYSIKFNQNGE